MITNLQIKKMEGIDMFKRIAHRQIKPILLIGLILGSILFVEFIPVEITCSEAFRQVHWSDK